jgi:CRISPR-associated endonuclease/helicase Cas3
MQSCGDYTADLLKTGNYSPVELDAYEPFFREVIWKANTLDKNDVIGYLTPDCEGAIQFRTAADKFKIIDDEQQHSIIVPYGNGQELIESLKKIGPERWLLRKLQRYTVSIHERDFNRLMSEGRLIEACPQIFVCLSSDYDLKTGLKMDDEPYDPKMLIMS